MSAAEAHGLVLESSRTRRRPGSSRLAASTWIVGGLALCGSAAPTYANHCTDLATQTLHVESTSGSGLVGQRVAIDGNRAYVCGAYAYIGIYDISNPLDPAFLGGGGSFFAGGGDIAVASGLAYVAYIGLTIFDVSNPTAIAQVGNVPISSPTSVALLGNFAYVGAQGGVFVVDVTVPTAPALVGTIAGMSVQDLVVNGDRLFVSANLGLRIYDLTTPSSPALLGSLGAGVGELCVAGNRAYIMNADGLSILDVANAASPAPLGFLASHNPWSNGFGLAIDGDRLYVATMHEAWLAMVDLYDVSQPTAPLQVGSCRLPSGSNSRMGLALTGGTLIAVGTRLWTIDVDPPQRSAPPIGFVDTPGSALDVAVSGTHAYVADQTSVQVVDLAAPSAPRLVGSLPIAANVVAASADLLLVGGTTARTLVNISDPTQPAIVGTLPGAGALDVALAGNRAFVCNGGALEIYDVTDPSAPTPWGSIGSGITTFEVEGNYAYIAPDVPGPQVSIIDLSGPAPVPVNYISTTSPLSLDVGGGYLYLTTSSGHQITWGYGLDNPAAPVFESYIEANVKMVAGGPDAFYAIAPRVAGQGVPELVAIAVDDPGWWGSLGVMPLADFAQSVRLAGGYVFVAEGASGLYIYPTNCTATDAGREPEIATGLRLLPAWPNPARQIAHWQLDLARATAVRLEVFDVAGRRVRSLWSGPLTAGRHVLAWDGRDDAHRMVASGVYLARLVSPAGVAQSRVSWMR